MPTPDVPDVEEPPSGPSRRVVVLYNADFDAPPALTLDPPPPPSARSEATTTSADIADVIEVAAHVTEALAALGFDPIPLAVHARLDDLIPTLRRLGAEAVFNLVESLGGDAAREPDVPALLAAAAIPFTGNRAPTLQRAQDKRTTRRLLSARRVPVPPAVTVTDVACIPSLRRAGVTFPAFVKPARQDASVGIDQGSIVHDMPQLRAHLARLAATVPGPWLVEAYLPGRELNVSFYPSPFAPARFSEVDFSALDPSCAPIVTYNCKWVPGTPDYNVCSRPYAPACPDAQRALEATARAALLAIGATGYARVDLRLDAHGVPHVIDVNPNPDLHPDAGFSLSARFAGASYHDLIRAILHHAWSAPHHARRPLPSHSPASARRPRPHRRDPAPHPPVHAR